jgi:hypothetical protein
MIGDLLARIAPYAEKKEPVILIAIGLTIGSP